MRAKLVLVHIVCEFITMLSVRSLESPFGLKQLENPYRLGLYEAQQKKWDPFISMLA